MIGRAAVGSPWLVGAIARALAEGGPLVAPALEEQRADALAHLESLLVRMGSAAGLRHARKHLAAYAAAAGADADLRRALVTTDDANRAAALLTRVYEANDLRNAA